ncbi:MAG TPA: succinyl-diaminopimelate desuccinylase [Jiangellales bacterium]|nr:succinyl-diaminopimelate desuccinylase [Jiangellales bacterium]
MTAPALDLDLPGPQLTARLCDIESVSGNETELADAIERELGEVAHLRIDRDGNTIIARTDFGHSERVVIAGHLDTVPVAGNLPVRRLGGYLWGRGTVDMKGGIAVALRLAAHVQRPVRDVTYVFYDNEEVESDKNGLGRVATAHPDWLAGTFAILMEPTSASVEGGCNGTMRVEVTVRGRAAHSARWWVGSNAIHSAGRVLDRLRSYEPAEIEVDGLTYREGLNAVGIRGGIAGNVIPDECVITVNFRFAPSRSEEEAREHVREVLGGFDVAVTDSAPGSRPGLTQSAVASFAATVGGEPRAKQGWTDVARFSAIGVPAVNYGPGDPQLAHHDDERVDVAEISMCEETLRTWLTTAP